MGRYALILVACFSASILLLVGCGAPEANNAQVKKADSPKVDKASKTVDDAAAEKKTTGEKAVTKTEKPSDKGKKEAKVKKADAEKKDEEKKLEKKMDEGEQREAAAKEPKPVAALVSSSESASASVSASASASTSAAPEQQEAAVAEEPEPIAAASASASAAPEQQEAAAAEEPEPIAAASASASADSSQDTTAAAPADTTMYLTVPKMGIYDVPVVEGTTEASLSAGAGHLSGTGYPWVEGSNTYIAGHRIGYPGTPSDMVFWDLPNLVAGDEIILTDSNGASYTYAVSEIMEVSPSDTSVTAPVGRDVVSLQTCTEDFGDYWTAGPNWYARYVVRADKVA